MPERILSRIRQAIRSEAYDLTAHAIEEMAEDRLDLVDMEATILNGKLVKVERDGPRGTRYTIHGLGSDGITPVGLGRSLYWNWALSDYHGI